MPAYTDDTSNTYIPQVSKMKLIATFSLFLATVLAESCSPNLNGCCYFDFTTSNNQVKSVNCHCDGSRCNTSKAPSLIPT